MAISDSDYEAMLVALDDTLLPEEKENRLRRLQSAPAFNPEQFGFQPQNPFEAYVDPSLTPAEKKAAQRHNHELLQMAPEQRDMLANAPTPDQMQQIQDDRYNEMLALGAGPKRGGQNQGAPISVEGAINSILPEPAGPGVRRGIASGAPVAPEPSPAPPVEGVPPMLERPPEAGAGSPVLPGQGGAGDAPGPVDQVAQASIQGALRGSPGTFVEGGPRVAGSMEAQTVLPEGAAEDIRVGAEASAASVLEGSQAQQTANLNEAIARANAAKKREKDLEAFRKKQASAQAELEAQQTSYEQTVADAKENPETFWSRKSTGQKISSVIGLALMGLSGKDMSQTVLNIIKDDNDEADKRFERMLGAARGRMADMRERVMSPEAQQAYEESVKLQIVANEMQAQALASGNDVLQKNAELAANEILNEAEQRLIGAQKIERQTRIQNDPDRVVGGRSGGLDAALKEGKKLGLTPQQTLNAVVTKPGQAHVFEGGGDSKTLFTMPSGDVVEARDYEAAKEARSAVIAYTETTNAMDRMAQIAKEAAASGIPFSETRTRLGVLLAATTNSIAKSYGGVVTDSDREGAKKELATYIDILERSIPKAEEARWVQDNRLQSKLQQYRKYQPKPTRGSERQ